MYNKSRRACKQIECWTVPDMKDTQSWLSLTGQLHGYGQETVGTLDLGGASTQITFLPQFEVSHLHESQFGNVNHGAKKVTPHFQTAAPPGTG